MERQDIMHCEHCKGTITTYYNKAYAGMRGKCSRCKIDFALE